jgi:hypothetical protein
MSDIIQIHADLYKDIFFEFRIKLLLLKLIYK